jgi:hypothetical protein
MRQLLDLARFFFPWTVPPQRWRSSLFQQGASGETRTVCSCLLAEAFDSVGFSILPFIHQDPDGSLCTSSGAIRGCSRQRIWVRLFCNDGEQRGNKGLARWQGEYTEDGASFGM